MFSKFIQKRVRLNYPKRKYKFDLMLNISVFSNFVHELLVAI